MLVLVFPGPEVHQCLLNSHVTPGIYAIELTEALEVNPTPKHPESSLGKEQCKDLYSTETTVNQ